MGDGRRPGGAGDALKAQELEDGRWKMGLRRRARRWRYRMEDFGLRIKDQEGRRRDAPQRGGRWDIGLRIKDKR
jgi:hypothetical protein